jgi:hypothetical protein
MLELWSSVITRASAEDLGLKKGEAVKVAIKSTEVMLQKDLSGAAALSASGCLDIHTRHGQARIWRCAINRFHAVARRPIRSAPACFLTPPDTRLQSRLLVHCRNIDSSTECALFTAPAPLPCSASPPSAFASPRQNLKSLQKKRP